VALFGSFLDFPKRRKPSAAIIPYELSAALTTREFNSRSRDTSPLGEPLPDAADAHLIGAASGASGLSLRHRYHAGMRFLTSEYFH
jgi:hypothetical protein